MLSSKNFVLIGKCFDQKTFFFKVWHKRVSPSAQHFLMSHPAKQVFQSLPFPSWTKFGEQIALRNKIFEFYLDDRDCKTYNKAAND